MIGQLKGTVVYAKPPALILEVNGVGYEIDMPIPDCANINVNSELVIYTHLTIREDAHQLYGFLNRNSRDSFRTLIKVSGVGPKIGLALLSTLNPTELEYALDNADVTTLCRTPGIGKKLAERMILELKGKLSINNTIEHDAKIQAQDEVSIIRMDVANALSSLGYNDKEISYIMQQLPQNIQNVSDGIKQALKLIK